MTLMAKKVRHDGRLNDNSWVRLCSLEKSIKKAKRCSQSEMVVWQSNILKIFSEQTHAEEKEGKYTFILVHTFNYIMDKMD